MGEQKRKEAAQTPLELLSKKLADDGRLIEAGWVALRIKWVPKDATYSQVRDMRWAYMAGAQHLFASIMTILDPGDDETPADLDKMAKIHKELETFRMEVNETVNVNAPTSGVKQ